MKRLAALTAVLVAALTAAVSERAPWEDDLTPIAQRDWNYDRAAHLLERAGFGGTPEDIEKLAKMTPQAAVQYVVRYQKIDNSGMPDFKPSNIFPSDDFVPPLEGGFAREIAQKDHEALGIKLVPKPGTMWVQPVIDYAYYLRFSNNGEIGRVAAYYGQRMLVTRRPLEEKLALFWHGHFATENDKVRDYRKMMAQWDTYRTLGNGNFGDLLLAMNRDPAMLTYLDGQKNVKGHPNENYAREILELFSLGVGNYTEHDIQEAARAFSGWGLDGNKFIERAELHDSGPKVFLGQKGNFDGQDIVAIVLKQPACGKFISKKLYRYFVRDTASPEMQEKLAEVLRANHYNVGAFLETMFMSRDFYSESSVATQIKSPVQLVVSTYRKLGLTEIPGAPNFNQTTAGLGQTLCVPPNVAGWKGGNTWINPATMIDRENFARYVLFPAETPKPKRKPMDFVPEIIGQRAYDQMNEMAQRGDFTSAPEQSMEDSGFNRREYKAETYNIFRGVYNGGVRMLKTLRRDPPIPAKVDLVAMLRAAGVKDTDGAVNYFGKRFLRAEMQSSDRASMVTFLGTRIGGKAIDYNRADLERDLRETLHLIMSVPEFQLS